jgi:hypothetical protein
MRDAGNAAVRRGVVGLVAYLVVLGIVLAVAFAFAQHDVIATGRFVESVDHDVARIRVLDRFTLYVDKTFVPFSSDQATSFMLMVMSGMAMLGFALAVAVKPYDRRLSTFFLLAAMGATVLAFDEHVELSEALGYNVESLYVPDFLIYGPPLALFALVYRRTLTASRPVLAVLTAGVVLFAVAQGIDRLPDDRFEGMEEKIEVVATMVLAVGLALLAVHHLSAGAQAGHDVTGLARGDDQGAPGEGGGVHGGGE